MTAFPPPRPTGIEELDDKRARILTALSRCHELFEGGLTGAPLASLISDALDYIEACLRWEEALLKAGAGEEAPPHLALHDLWRDRARKLGAAAGSRQGAREFFAFASRWWADHELRDLESHSSVTSVAH